jgi:hypothetical protein
LIDAAQADKEQVMRPFRIPLVALALAAGIAFAAPAGAGEKPEPLPQIESTLNPRLLLQGAVREEDVALLFDHIRAALLASYQGREAPSAEELNRRMEAIGAELRTRGMIAGMLLLAAFEAAARQAVREGLAEPAPR